jgi:uncharacterized protein (DUF433 family)
MMRPSSESDHSRPEAQMSSLARIEVNPKVMLGKPVMRGSRITVELILRNLADGATEADLLEAYPDISHEDIRAAIRYAAAVIAHEEIEPISGTGT